MASTGTNLPLPALPPDPAIPPDPALPPGEGEEPAGRRLLTFELAGRAYGCALDGVREIIVGRAATRLPGAPAHVVGIMNLRGTLVTVIDLAARLLPGAAARAEGHVIVVEVEGRLVGCRVDAVRRVRPLPALDPPPAGDDRAGGNENDGGIVMGIGEVDGELVAVLDLGAIVRQTLLFTGER